MASLRLLRLLLVVFLLVEALVMFSSPIKADEEDDTLISDDEDDTLLKRINTYRISLGLSALAENKNADCLADEIAEQLEDQPCPVAITSRLQEAQFYDYQRALKHCHLNLNNTRDGAILLSCFPGRDESHTVSDFSHPFYSQHLNDSKYTGAGIDFEDEWTVVVLATNTPGGSFVQQPSFG